MTKKPMDLLQSVLAIVVAKALFFFIVMTRKIKPKYKAILLFVLGVLVLVSAILAAVSNPFEPIDPIGKGMRNAFWFFCVLAGLFALASLAVAYDYYKESTKKVLEEVAPAEEEALKEVVQAPAPVEASPAEVEEVEASAPEEEVPEEEVEVEAEEKVQAKTPAYRGFRPVIMGCML